MHVDPGASIKIQLHLHLQAPEKLLQLFEMRHGSFKQALHSFIFVFRFIFSEASVQSHTGESDPIAVMGALRQEKDNFKAKI